MKRTLILVISILLAPLAFGEGVIESIGLLASDGSGEGLVGLSIAVVSLILAASFAIGILSLDSFPFSLIAKLTGHVHANNLFLKIKFLVVKDHTKKPPVFSPKNAPIEMNGFLRALDLKGATLVMREPLEIGSMVRLDLSSLPSFLHGSIQIDGEVKSSKKITDLNDYIIEIEFASVSAKAKDPLISYLKQLTA